MSYVVLFLVLYLLFFFVLFFRDLQNKECISLKEKLLKMEKEKEDLEKKTVSLSQSSQLNSEQTKRIESLTTELDSIKKRYISNVSILEIFLYV